MILFSRAEETDHWGLALSPQPDSVVLESSAGDSRIARHDLLAARARGRFTVTDGQWSLSDDWPADRPPPTLSPWNALRWLLQRTQGAGSDPFAGGWVGYLGYDLAPLIERLPRRRPRAGALPDLSLAYYDTFAIRDRITGQARVHAVDRFQEGERSRIERQESLEALLAGSSARIADPIEAPFVDDIRPDVSAAEYQRMVARAIEYIGAGDIFQVNLSQRFSGRWTGDLPALWSQLRRQSPSPFSALVRVPGGAVLSSSPERFFSLTPDRWVETRPIKGTRPRGLDPMLDVLLRDELRQSAKDRAELTMIVDLERNDLGRVCEFGSVVVARHAQVESYRNVHHLVSTVRGRLHPRFDVVDLLRASFPGGSITGAPKIRAMQIIDELEPCRRGPYTGAIGYVSDHGRCDFNIAIRTIVIDQESLCYHVGGGIVADSDPLSEYRETLVKGTLLRRVLETLGK